MSDQQPLVSILVSVFNGGTSLEDALSSIEQQVYQNVEILIMNDASTDKSSCVIDEFQKRNKSCFVFNHQKKEGLAKSLNELAKKARGTYIARMDADDVCTIDRLEKQISFLEQHPDVGVCGGRGWLVDDHQNKTELNVPVGFVSKRKLIYHNQCIHPTLVFRRDVFEMVGGYDEKKKYSQDYDLLLKMRRITNIVNIPDRIIYYHFSKKSFLKYGKKQEMHAICARIKALVQGGYPYLFGTTIILLRFFWLLVPQSLKYRFRYGK